MSVKEIELEIVNNWNNDISCPITLLLHREGVKGIAEHIGSKQYAPTNEWKAYNKQKSYAKTDIKIGDYKISLKTTKDHILMSAKKNEALATFMCVADELYGNHIPNIITDITKDMENMVQGVSPLSIAKAKKTGDETILDAQTKHAQILDSMEHMFENDPTFHAYFVKEVLSGELKFGKDSDGSATHMIVMTKKPVLHSLDDMDFIGDVSGHVDMRIDFKSSKKVQGPENGMYRYWSCMQMISKYLKEGVIPSFLSKAYSFLLDIISRMKANITSWKDVFDFMEVEPNITISEK